MSASRVRAVIMYPGQHGFPIRNSVTGPLFEALESARVVVLLPAGEVKLEVVEQVATDHPALPVVVSEVGHSSARELYPVFTKCPNVRIELSGYMVHRGIEDIVGKFGDGRILFGTRYPLFNPGCAVANVMYASISDDAKKSIASGNAERLLAEVRLK
jgi:predicted TIM-barrel fold metal-dependent hydrolase